ncbi:MAG: hypothetical protein WCO98_00140 [bacterium]
MRLLIIGLFMAILSSFAVAVENQAYLGIFAETSSTKMVGMPDMPDMPDIDPKVYEMMPGGAMPGMSSLMGPQRLLSVRLWSPSIAKPDATASIAIPDGLKLGKTMNLSLYRPEPEKGTADPKNPDLQLPDFTIKRYWGSSEKVKTGQPEIFSFKDLTPEQKAMMREAAKQAEKKSSYYYKPNWTTGYWPAENQPGTVRKDAVLQGKYSLTTNYTGNVDITVPQEVNFLAPIKMSSPKFSAKIPLDKAITFKWDAVPGILGYYAQIIGMQGTTTLIMWNSAEVRTEPDMAWDYLQMADVINDVKDKKFMGPEQVTVTVPAGIFKDCDVVNMRMIGYGPATALDGTQPLPRVQTKTTFSVMLGGKMMDNMMVNMPVIPIE